MPQTAANYKALRFFIPTYILTWCCWFAISFVQNHNVKEILFVSGLISPCSIALLLIFLSKDSIMKKQFLNKLVNPRLIQPDSIPALILIPPLSIILAVLLSLPFGYSIHQLTIANSFTFSIGAMPTFLVLLFAACFEELGWRGYGMESLMINYNYLYGTFIFSILWSIWHFPLFFVENSYHYNILHLNPLYALNFMVGVIPFAFIINWLWKKNNYSILVAVCFHFIANITQELFMVEPVTKCIQTIVYLFFAICIVYRNREIFFDEHRVTQS
jgi:membrane protease YdiL (CAAX protease family)